MSATGEGRPALPPNQADPVPPLLGEAAADLARPLLTGTARSLQAAVVVLIAAGLALSGRWALLVSGAAGAVAAFLALTLAYIVWSGRFCHLNRRHAPLCPRCTSRLWQLCCGRCGEPVPLLALWLRGLFLARCPHCGLRLSLRRRSLLAWCSTCNERFERPDRLYAKPTHVIAWIDRSLPSRIGGGWVEVGREGDRLQLYHAGDGHSASLMFLCAGDREGGAPIPDHLIPRTRLLLLSSDLPEPWAERVRGHFGPRTICETVAPI